MKILLINVDSKKFPNIALEKIRMYHEMRGDAVFQNYPLLVDCVDRIYCSVIFERNRAEGLAWKKLGARIGGSGVDLETKLPRDIEVMKPRLNVGFTTRGCVRKCSFCYVPRMEGNLRVVGDIYDFWDGESPKITLFDNNILADPKHFSNIVAQIRRENLEVDFNQGLDFRLIVDANAREIASVKVKRIRGAWDEMRAERSVKRGIGFLSKYVSPSRIMIYVLVGYDTDLEEDLYRAREIVRLGCDPYIMRYNQKTTPTLTRLAYYCNRRHYRRYSWREFLEWYLVRRKYERRK